MTPDNWLVRIDDIVRTTVVVRYMDGVHVVRRLISERLQALGFDEPTARFKAKSEGYYAMHAYVKLPLPYQVDKWHYRSELITVEIQACTQIQEVLRTLTHPFHVERRAGAHSIMEDWSWREDCPEFVPNYLGHILHYADGMILNVRKRHGSNQ